MNEIKLFENREFGTIRTVIFNGKPWFVGKDAVVALGYTDLTHAVLDHVDEVERINSKAVGLIDPEFGQRGTWLIDESGLYSLIFGSKLESAKRFKYWVTSEVLPSIRKTGGYAISQNPDSYTIEDPVERAKRWIEEQEEKKILESKIEEMKPKAELCDKLLDASLLVNFRDAAKEIGISQSQLIGWLKEKGYVYSNSSGELRPMEKYMESGLFEVKPYQNPYNGHKGSRTMITGRGLAAFKVLIDDSGHNRDTMKKHGGRKKK